MEQFEEDVAIRGVSAHTAGVAPRRRRRGGHDTDTTRLRAVPVSPWPHIAGHTATAIVRK